MSRKSGPGMTRPAPKGSDGAPPSACISRRTSRDRESSTSDIILSALLSLGGDARFLDIEHVAVRAAELAPDRFRWAHFPGQVDLRKARDALCRLAVSRTGGAFVLRGADRDWMLSPEGTALARTRPAILASATPPGSHRTPRQRTLRKRERERLEAEPAMRKYRSGNADAITRREALDCFRIDDFADMTARRARIERLMELIGREDGNGDGRGVSRDRETRRGLEAIRDRLIMLGEA